MFGIDYNVIIVLVLIFLDIILESEFNIDVNSFFLMKNRFLENYFGVSF